MFHEHTSSVSQCTAEEGSVSGQDQDVSDEDCNPYVSETEDNNEDDSGKDDTDHDDIDEYLSCGLGARASDFNIQHSALSVLLGILRTLHPHLPKDPRTLLGTARQYQIKSISGGSYHHFGIATSLKNAISTVDTSGYVDAQSVNIQLNIDGLPLFQSSLGQFWPELLHLSPLTHSSLAFTVEQKT